MIAVLYFTPRGNGSDDRSGFKASTRCQPCRRIRHSTRPEDRAVPEKE